MSLKFQASNSDTLRIEFGHQRPEACEVMLPFVDKKGKLQLQKKFKLARKCYGRVVKLIPQPDGKNKRVTITEAIVDCHPEDNYVKEEGRTKVLKRLASTMTDSGIYSTSDVDVMLSTYEHRPRLAQTPKEGGV